MCFIRMDKASVNRYGGVRWQGRVARSGRQFKQMGTLFVLLSGGEPMLHPDFEAIYQGLKQMGFILTVNTNGSLIDERAIALFREYTPRRVNVTLLRNQRRNLRPAVPPSRRLQPYHAGLRLLKERRH
jgi:MoaA/NifB/PqqE/SkfB family radical SAM enzyme